MLFGSTLFTFILPIKTSTPSGVGGVDTILFFFIEPKYDRCVFLVSAICPFSSFAINNEINRKLIFRKHSKETFGSKFFVN